MTIRIVFIFLLFFLIGCAQFDRKLYQDTVTSGVEEGTGYSFQFSTNPGEPLIPENVNIEDGISEDEAILISLWNNAAYQETLSDLGFARADTIKAGLLPNPMISLLFPVDDRHYESSFTMALDAIWLRPRRLSIAEIQSKQIAQRLIQNGFDLVRDVRMAFSVLGEAKSLAQIANDSAELQKRIADLSDKRLESGDISELETLTARIESRSAMANATMLAHESRLARQKVVSMIGLGFMDVDLAFNDPSNRILETIDQPALLREALERRPDYQAAKLAVKAAGDAIGLASADFLKISAQIDGDEIDNRFQFGPGFKIEIPIFHRNQDGIALAQAEFEKNVRHLIVLRDQIQLEVAQSFTSYMQAKENLEIFRAQILKDIEMAVRQAENAYEHGNISFLLTLETTSRLFAAREQEAKSESALRKSLAELERNVGKRLDVAIDSK